MMIRYVIGSVFSIALVVLSFHHARSSDDIYYRVSNEHLRCLVENVRKYLQQPDDLLIIAIDLCPNIVQDPLLEATTNENPDLPKIDDDNLDRLIVIKKRELACIAGVNADLGRADVFEILPERCMVRPGAN